MSQVVKAITAHGTGDRRIFQEFSPLFQDVFSVKTDVQEFQQDFFAKRYRIGVTIGAEAWVSDLETINGVDSLGEAIKRTNRQVIEAIFGEFRHDFMMIQRALYDRDFQNARTLLAEFENKMFGWE